VSIYYAVIVTSISLCVNSTQN